MKRYQILLIILAVTLIITIVYFYHQNRSDDGERKIEYEGDAVIIPVEMITQGVLPSGFEADSGP